MGFWSALDSFWDPIEDEINDFLEYRDKKIERDIRREIESEEILAKWDREEKRKRNNGR